MAEYRQELAHEKKEIERRSRDRKLVREDVQLTQDVINELKHIKIQLKKTEQLMRDIGKNSKMQ